MCDKTYRRFSTEFEFEMAEAYPAGGSSLKGLATKACVDHSLVHYWLKKYHAGELSLDIQREEESVETAQRIAALERKVGQLTIELDLKKGGTSPTPRRAADRRSSSPGRRPQRMARVSHDRASAEYLPPPAAGTRGPDERC
jgi:transposase